MCRIKTRQAIAYNVERNDATNETSNIRAGHAPDRRSSSTTSGFNSRVTAIVGLRSDIALEQIRHLAFEVQPLIKDHLRVVEQTHIAGRSFVEVGIDPFTHDLRDLDLGPTDVCAPSQRPSRSCKRRGFSRPVFSPEIRSDFASEQPAANPNRTATTTSESFQLPTKFGHQKL